MDTMSRIFRTCLTALLLLLAAALPVSAATDPAIMPVNGCEDLASLDIVAIGGEGSVITAARLTTNTAGILACTVTGRLAPSIGFAVILPASTWTGRFLQIGCGGLCGKISLELPAGYGCLPLATGQFVLAATDMGHQGMDPDSVPIGRNGRISPGVASTSPRWSPRR